MLALLLATFLCPTDMVDIPAGTWTFGADGANPRWVEPAQQRELPQFCIDRYEYPNTEGALPRVDVTWAEAASLCAARVKRLCTADEWERACRGPKGHRHAYGDTFERARCNTPLDTGGPEGAIPYAASGSHPDCVSAEGAFDLNGNVSEWVSDPWDLARFGPPEGQGPEPAGDLRQLRGGTMWSGTFYGQSCLSRHAHPEETVSDDDGFRCCMDPVSTDLLVPTGVVAQTEEQANRGQGFFRVMTLLILLGGLYTVWLQHQRGQEE